MESSKDDWCIPCLANDLEELEPLPEELESMYELLNNGSMLELQWKCPGRRLPSPVATNDTEIEDQQEKDVSPKKQEFDFMDEVTAPQMRVRGQNSAPKGSAKKKTANFAGVIDAMKKHGRLSQTSAAVASPKDTS